MSISSPRAPQKRSTPSMSLVLATPPRPFIHRAGLLLLVLLLAGMTGAGTSPAQELPGVLVQQGERYLAMGKYKAALARYAKVLQCCPDTAEAAEAHNDSGVALSRLGREAEAETHYLAALEINRYPLALYNLARLYGRRSHDEQYCTAQRTVARKRAQGLYGEFAEWLESDAPKPPSVDYQREALLEDVRRALSESEGTP